jgi:hypothetical protein
MQYDHQTYAQSQNGIDVRSVVDQLADIVVKLDKAGMALPAAYVDLALSFCQQEIIDTKSIGRFRQTISGGSHG